MGRLKILTTGAGSPGARGIFKAFRMGAKEEGRGLEIITCDMDSQAYGFHLAEKGHTIPPGSDPGFVKSILDICEKERPNLLFSWVTPELLPLSLSKSEFKKLGVRVVTSGPEAIRISQDKARSLDLAKEFGLGYDYRRVKTPKEFERAVGDLGYPEKPVCFKPIRGYGMRGFRILDPNINRGDLLFKEKPDSSLTNLETVMETLNGMKDFPEIMVMEFLKGREYTVDMLLKNGEPILTIPRERVRVKLGISNIARLENNKELIEASNKIGREIGLDYNVNMQFILSQDGPKLIEVQPRLAGTTVACLGAGINMPWMAVKVALGEDFKVPEVKWGTVMKRFWEEVYTNGKECWFL